MTTALKRVFAIGLISHVLAFSILFTILCGLFPNGTDYLFCFFFTAVVIAAVVYVSASSRAGSRGRLMVVGSTVVLLLGLAVLGWVAGRRMSGGLVFAFVFCFAVVGFFLLRRSVMMVVDLKYVREALLGQFKVDVVLAVGLSLVVVFFAGTDSRWETKILPLFTAFLLTRMMAFSLASQLDKEQNMRKSLIEKFQRRMPYLVVAAGLLLMWILETIGGPIWRAVIGGIVYVLEAVAEFIAEHFDTPWWLKVFMAKFKQMFMLLSTTGNKTNKFDDQKMVPVEHTTVNWLWLQILLGIVVAALVVWYLFRVLKRMVRVQTSGNEVEIREFIHSEKPGKKRAWGRLSSEANTPMRKIYRKFLLGLRGRDFARYPGETANELVAKVSASHPEWRAPMHELTEYYMRERYGGQSVEQQLPRAEGLAKELGEPKGGKKR